MEFGSDGKNRNVSSGSAGGPLAGVRIIDMTSVVLGPYATQILGDLGADIVKIEQGKGDTIRHAGKSPAKGLGPMFVGLNRNKRLLELDLRKASSAKVMKQLLKTADVFIHNVRAAGMARLGFDYDSVKSINPKIIYVHCCGFGEDGAYRGRAAYDDLIQAASGMANLLPRRDGGEPQYFPSLVADKTAGLYAVYATIAALFNRERVGTGQFVEVPMMETVTHFNMVENLYGHTFVPPLYDVGYTRSINPRRKPYKTKDGYIAIVPYNDEQWSKFFEIGGKPGVFEDERFSSYARRTENTGLLYEIIEEVALKKTTEEWMDILHDANIPVMRYSTMSEVLEDPHLQSIDFFSEREHPEIGAYLSVRHPVTFSATPTDIRYEPGRVGRDTRQILDELAIQNQTEEY